MMPTAVTAAVPGLDQHGSGITRSLPLPRVGARGSPILTLPCSVYGSGAALASACAGACPLHAKAGWDQGGMLSEEGLALAREELDPLQISRVRKSP